MENFLNRIIDAVNGRNLLDALYDALHTEGMNDFWAVFKHGSYNSNIALPL